MRSVVCSIEGSHAINAGEICATALVAVWIEFLLGENISTSLVSLSVLVLVELCAETLTSHWKETILRGRLGVVDG
jgi:hypothetical protein